MIDRQGRTGRLTGDETNGFAFEFHYVVRWLGDVYIVAIAQIDNQSIVPALEPQVTGQGSARNRKRPHLRGGMRMPGSRRANIGGRQ